MLHRRHLIAAASAALVGLPGRAASHATPAQTEGPFYPLFPPDDDDADLLRNGARARDAAGEPTVLQGTVVGLDGRPLAGAVVEIWQCDAHGHYHHPGDGDRADPAFQGFGQVTVGADGRYRFRTLRPVPYSGRTPHIHVKVKHGGRERLTTQLYVAGEPRNERDFLWRRLDAAGRAALTRPFARGGDGWEVAFPIVVRA